jgi:hypothetical protein
MIHSSIFYSLIFLNIIFRSYQIFTQIKYFLFGDLKTFSSSHVLGGCLWAEKKKLLDRAERPLLQMISEKFVENFNIHS